MKLLSPVNLEVNFFEPEPLIVALFVRDALGLDSGQDQLLPRLDPAVTGRDFSSDPDEHERAAKQWSSWWSEILGLVLQSVDGVYVPVDYASLLASRPELLRLAGPVLDEAAAWFRGQLDVVGGWKDPHSDRFLPFRVMALVKALLRRRDRHQFSRTVFLVLPLSGEVGWRAAPARYVVSKYLVRDDKLFEKWLAEQLLRTDLKRE
jgi:hypothetical protein